jgi:hypothetical protein
MLEILQMGVVWGKEGARHQPCPVLTHSDGENTPAGEFVGIHQH